MEEAFTFHARTLALDEAALRKDPNSAVARRNYAGELTMTAYAEVLGREDLDKASELSRRAIEIDQALRRLIRTTSKRARTWVTIIR